MLHSTFLLSLTLVRLSIAGYVLQDSYNPSNFFDKFNFFDGQDPTEGFVKLVNKATAQSSNLITTSSDSVKFGVDSSNVTPDGRSSIRIESKQSYNQGLIIADIAHMPGSICGTWPAFWTIGPDWPANGEIDIIEGVNSQTMNAMTLHTAPGCSIASNGKFTGSIKTPNCDTRAPGQGTNVGCGIGTTDTTTYGDGFNSAGGGVYATEWTADAITIHHFSRTNIPADVMSGKPDPSTWGPPLAVFSGCNFPQVIRNQTIIFDTTFCGQWAGQQSVWESDAVCSKKAATCQDYVKNNPADFANAYWQVNSVKVYQLGDGFIGSAPVPASSSSVSKPTSIQLPTTVSLPTTLSTTSLGFGPTPPAGTTTPAIISSEPFPSSVQIVTVEQTTTMTLDNSAAAAQQTGAPGRCVPPHREGCISKGKAEADRARQASSSMAMPRRNHLHRRNPHHH